MNISFAIRFKNQHYICACKGILKSAVSFNKAYSVYQTSYPL